MKRAVPITITIFGILFLLAPDVQQAIVMLILAGIIPGTNISVPPLLMLALLVIALVIVVRWTRHQDFYVQAATQQHLPTKTKKKIVPGKSKARRKAATRAKRKVAAEQAV